MSLRCGVDIVRTTRLGEISPAIRRRFIQRVYTQQEQAQARDDNERLSALFAAKEAASKALGTGIGRVNWRHIEVLHRQSGEPYLVLHHAALARAQALGLTNWAVSLSHEAGLAVAMVVAQSQPKNCLP